MIRDDDRVVCVLTGNLLKDPDAVLLPVDGVPSVEEQVITVKPDLESVRKVLEQRL
jgi:threonine synthase